jgi:hypothetical protein
LGRGLNERPEDAALDRVGVGKIFQMPLHTQIPAVMPAKGDRLNGAVGRVGGSQQLVS